MSPTSFIVALAVVTATLSVPPVEGYYYYYVYYYPQPNQCQTNSVPTQYKTCPISSCHCSTTYNSCCLRSFTYGNLLYKQCICETGVTCAPPNETLDNPPPQTLTTTSTTTTPETTTTPTTTSTTATTTTSTTATTTPTTTSTSTTSTTTPAFKSLCDSGLRLLNGDAVGNCDSPGIANITLTDKGDQVCNAVLASATVNNVYKPTFVTAAFCTTLIQGFAKDSNVVSEIQIGEQRYPIVPPLVNMVQGANGASFLDISERYANLLNDLGCQKLACAYNKATMEGKVDMNDCKMVSWGVSDAGSLMSTGLHEAKIALNPTGCSGITDTSGATSTLCFTTASGKNLNCAKDGGAPVYCKAPSNGEDILMGVTTFQAGCNNSSDVKVIPYPG
ncbi:hypothetical protein BsWGS_25072 [Bradybaena similaris]